MTTVRFMNSRDPRVRVAVVYIQERYPTVLSIEELAKSLNLSSSRLRHLIKADIGLSPNRYIRTLRLERAKHLLGTNFLSIKEIMGQVGYNDPSHFARDFKAVIGMSPRQYRLLMMKAY